MKYLLAALIAALYFYQGSQIVQSQFIELSAVGLGLFALYLYAIKKGSKSDLTFYIILGFVCRAILIFLLPNLSDDIYRFYWDGHLLLEGIKPYAFTPTELLQSGQLPKVLNEIYPQLNSPDYYSVYPAITQYLFAFAAWLSSSLFGFNVILKLLFLSAEILSIGLIYRLLKHFKMDEWNVLWYTLNPLIIIEFAGNLHFECIMITGVLAAFYLIIQKRIYLSAIAFSVAIGTKLIPLILVPLLIKRVSFKSLFILGAICLGLLIGMFFPLIHEGFFQNFWSSLDLYFRSFEFNASIYYLVRWLGYQYKGYNLIASIGPFLALISMISIFAISLKPKHQDWRNFPTAVLFVGLIYLLLSTTVHPWYLGLFLAFSCFSDRRFMIIWSLLIFLSYSHYWGGVIKENYLLIAIEYICLTGAVFYEWHSNRLSISK